MNPRCCALPGKACACRFWQRGEQLVLPAFGHCTGLMDVRRADCRHAGQRLYLVQDELAVLALPDGERA